MDNVFYRENLKRAWRFVKPWVTIFSILFIFRVTGLLSGISYYAGSALLKTGIMDAPVNNIAKKTVFDYNFSVKDMEGNEVDFNSFKGKVVFLNIWATWCGPCRLEMPSIQEVYNEVDHDEIAFVILSVDRNEDSKKVKKYAETNKHTFPIYMPSGNLPKLLRVESIPTTFVINKEGEVVTHKVGYANYNTAAFKKFLQELVQ